MRLQNGIQKPVAAKTILDVQRNECRFPIGEIENVRGRHIMCGAKCRPDKTYCDRHMSIAYQPLRPRR